ncbi:unnamed protein product [Notodromas monacha]|uniref:Enoyl-CoA delta isomerase 1, mitochondrial n=1 Tax=Notodromas monacha TaxID=399045 RepID=A0A7R9BID2_9CRUS|nr:unnamed protein product [Notodromas monacha]CAG0916054.1 unnamed protein product [Notodromas monacha]
MHSASKVLRVGFSRFPRVLSVAMKSTNVSSNVCSETGIGTLMMSRAPVNGLNYDFLKDFREELEKLDQDKACKAVIITSSVKNIFSAGLDIMEMVKPEPKRLRDFWLSLQDMWNVLYTYRLPTVALINGHSPAGGCLIASGCDYRVMLDKTYTIGLNETKLGIVAPFWSEASYHFQPASIPRFMDAFVALVGTRQADLHLQLGTLFTPQEALKNGLVDELASSEEEAREKSVAAISKFLAVPGFPRYMTKTSVRSQITARFVDGRDNDLETFLNFVQMPATQKTMIKYVEALKAKKPKL